MKKVFKISFLLFGIWLALFFGVGSAQAENQAPVCNISASRFTMLTGETVLISGSAWDPDRDRFTWVWGADGGGRLDSYSGPPNKTYTAPDFATVATIVVAVTDNLGHGRTCSTQVIVESVSPPQAVSNQAPVCNISASSFAILTGETVLISGSAVDLDGDPFTWAWGADGGGRLDSYLDPPNKTYRAPGHATIATIVAQVADNRGHGRTCSTQVIVRSSLSPPPPPPPSLANQPPSCNIELSSSLIWAGETISISGGASDPEGDPVTWSWQLGGGSLVEGYTGPPPKTYTAPERATVATIAATVMDSWGYGTVCSREVTVRSTSPPPTLSVTLEAIPDLGTPPINIYLKFKVSGTATGPIYWRAICDLERSTGWGSMYFITNEDTKTITEPCGYMLPGIYTAAVQVKREEVGPVQATATITLFGAEAAPSRVDIKANYSNDPLPITYNSSVVLTWGTLHVIPGSCRASGDWSGTKADNNLLGEVTENLTSETYAFTLTCKGQTREDVSDTVRVRVEAPPPSTQPTLLVELRAFPNSGTAPLTNVGLRATVSGTAIGTINYKFDCTNDGIWDYTYEHIPDNPKTVICNYPDPDSYTAKVYVERDTASPAQAMTVIRVDPSSPPPPPPPPPPSALSVSLVAIPNSGPASLNDVDLKATVSGTATGTINYKFDCTSDGTWDHTFNNSQDNPKTVVGACDYPSSGTYAAKVRVERGAANPAEAIAAITVSTPTPPPPLPPPSALSVSLVAIPNSGPASLNDVDLKATVSGTSIGTINYTFYCNRSDSGTNIISGYDHKRDNTFGLNPYTAFNLCDYSSAGTYTAKVIVEREGLAAENRETIIVTTSLRPPPSPTLSVVFRALPDSGPAPLNVALMATVSGTAIGTINYKFDCTSDGVWDHTFNNIPDNPKTVVCDYPNPGTYAAKVKVERGAASPAEAIATITVSGPTLPPPPPPPGPPGIYRIPVLILRYFPTRDGINIDDEITGIAFRPISVIRAHTEELTNQIIQALGQGSRYHGYKNATSPSLSYEILKTTEFLEPIPTKGIRADHLRILSELNICDWVENRGIKEVWIWMYHTDRVAPVESYQTGPGHRFGNGYMELPRCQKSYTVYDYNYGRGLSEALEDHTHHLEAIFRYIDAGLFWYNDISFTGGKYEFYPNNLNSPLYCGWTHCPPNVIISPNRCGANPLYPQACICEGYNWYSERTVLADCENWKPDGTGQKTQVNCQTWSGGPGCRNQDPFKDGDVGFKVWWMQNIPGKDNNLTYQGRAMRNWWEFVGDFDSAMTRGRSFVYPSAATTVATDLNQDGQTNVEDVRISLQSWGGGSPMTDLNKDGRIDVLDLEILRRQAQK